jgi:hypothetical protein
MWSCGAESPGLSVWEKVDEQTDPTIAQVRKKDSVEFMAALPRKMEVDPLRRRYCAGL